MAGIGIEVIEISGSQRDRLMVAEEGHFSDFKAAGPRCDPRHMA